jgi:DNA-binding response OmpR family regulator
MTTTLLLVEDDDAIAHPLVRALQREGYEVERTALGEEAVRRVARGGLDLVLLDLGLPDLDGTEVCRRIREAGHQVPVMMVTSRSEELDRVVGLDVGADDYLPKPFGLAELSARIRALLRRSGSHRPAGRDTAPDGDGAAPAPGHLEVHRPSRRVRVGGREVALSPKEFDLLAVLDREPGTVVTREALMDEVWDENWFGSTKTLDVTVARLRQKLEEHGCVSRIVTVRGVGFRLEGPGAG